MLKKQIFYFTCLIMFSLLLSLPNLKVGAKVQEHKITSDNLKEIKEKLINLINENRSSLGRKAVILDTLAGEVGERHCKEMLRDRYFSHWNTQGLKPYMRYSRFGGRDAVTENLSFSEGGGYYDTVDRLTNILMEMHLRMFNEKPPNDGHRQAIIYPYNTHIGIGIAFDENRVKLAEEFICRYTDINPVPTEVKTGEQINFSGKISNFKEYELAGISLFYEESPQLLTREELNSLGSYSFPQNEVILKPILSGNIIYTDGSKGEIDYKRSNGNFSCQLAFSKERKGICTVVVWLKKEKEKFQATNISIEIK